MTLSALSSLLFVPMPGPFELIIIMVIVLLLFGGKKLPDVARSVGQAMRAFRDESNKLKKEFDSEAPKNNDDKSSSLSQSESTPEISSEKDSVASSGQSETKTAEQKN